MNSANSSVSASLMHGTSRLAAAVALLDVDGEAEPHVLVPHDSRGSVGRLDEGVVHHPDVVGDGADDGVADQVGEADLAAAGASEVAVDDTSVDLEELGGDLPERRGRRDVEAGRHVGDDPGSDTADRLARELGVGGRRSACSRPLAVVTGAVDGAGPAGAAGVGAGAGAGLGAGAVAALGAAGRAVVREEVPPGLADRCRVVLVLLVRLFDQPGVRTVVLGIDRSGGGRGVRHGAMLPTPDRCLSSGRSAVDRHPGHLDSAPCSSPRGT